MSEILGSRALVNWMLRVEQALACAEEACGVIPPGTAQILREIQVSSLDLERISQGSVSSGNICIPFVKLLTALVAELDPGAASYVHWGATSQDIIDTAMVLQMRQAFAAIVSDVDLLCSSLADRIAGMGDNPMTGRTWLQAGPPVTMRLKMATWLDAVQRHRERTRELEPRVFALQFGGAVGTLAALKDKGTQVASTMACELRLQLPNIPWHTQRDRFAELATFCGLVTGSLGKIGRDVSLLMQTEVGEFAEPAQQGRGGSSTMPHKQNPIGCAVMLSGSIRVPGLVSTMLSAMVQEHERALGGWHSEWETLSDIVRITSGSLARGVEIARDGIILPAAMQRNLEVIRDLPLSEAASFLLASKIGKARAHQVVENAAHRAQFSGSSLVQELICDREVMAHLREDEIAGALTASEYMGVSAGFVDAVLRRERHWNGDAPR